MSFRDTLRFIILACFFATPFIGLYFADSMFFPFITGKNFAFRILVEVMLGAWVLLMFIDATYRPRFSWILVAAGTFLAVMTVADFTGVNPYRSFWSNYERMEGLITLIHLFLYFIIAGSVLTTDHAWKWFWRTSLGVSLIVAVYAYAQLHGGEAIHQSSNRLDATFGNSIYLAIYALFHFFLAAFLFFRESKEDSLFRFAYPVVAVVNLVVIYYTQTRGTLLGLVGGVFLALLLAALFDREHPERKKYAMGGVLGVLILVVMFVAWRDAPWIQANKTLGRMANISLTDPTTISRFMIWNMSWEGFKERPLLGWGQDNFLYVFAKHYNPKMWNQEPWFDRSHDVFFDWLIAGGALGLLAYLSLFLAALYYIWSSKNQHLSVLERGVLTGMLVGYFIHNIFVFDNLTSYIVFFAFLGYLHAQSLPAVPPQNNERSRSRAEKGNELEAGDLAVAAVIVVALTASIIYLVNIRNINANIALINALRPEGIFVVGPNGQKEIAIKEVLDRRLFGTGEAREQLAQLAMHAVDPRVPEEIRRQFYELTASEFEQELADDPTNVRMISFAAAFYQQFGQFDKALGYFKKAIELSPKRQPPYLDLSQMLSAEGNHKDAEQVAKIGYELEPKDPDSALAYAVALVYQKKLEEADSILAPFRGSSLVYQSRLVNAYGNGHYYDKVVELLNEKIAKGDASGRDYLALSGAYAGLGENAKAIAAVEKGMSVDATIKAESEQVLRQLKGNMAH